MSTHSLLSDQAIKDLISVPPSANEASPLLRPSIRDQGPPDRFLLALNIFFLMGLGMLFPWNIFITATSFFKLKFRGSVFADNFESFFSITYNVANIIALLILMNFSERLSTPLKVYSSLFSSLVVFALITGLVKVGIDPTTYFVFIIICVTHAGIATGLLQNGIFALAARFPFNYTAATMSGQGLAGLVVALSQILSLLVGGGASGEESDASIELSALIYFGICVLVIVLSILGFALLLRLPIYLFFQGYEALPALNEGEEEGPEAKPEGGEGPTWETHQRVMRKLTVPALAVCYDFSVTLAIFPTLIALIEPVVEDHPSRIFGDLFVPFAFLIFNAGDLSGRVLAGALPLPRPAVTLGLSLLRTVFFFLFLCSNVVLRDAEGEIIESSLPVLFGNDYVYWAFVLAFALSNGYVASVSMMTGPNLVSSREKALAGSWMIFALVAGLCIGSFLSFGLRGILCQCNPFSS